MALIVVTLTTSGVIRVAIGSATGMTGAVPVLNLKITSRSAAGGFIYLYGLDVAGVDGTSLTAATTSTTVIAELPITGGAGGPILGFVALLACTAGGVLLRVTRRAPARG